MPDTPEPLGGCACKWQAAKPEQMEDDMCKERNSSAPVTWDEDRAPKLADALAVPEVARLVEAAGHARLALACYVSARSAVDKLDNALAAMEGR